MHVSEGVGRFVGDRYQLVRELGRGGMGVVYLGRDLRRDMDVAIKFHGITHHDATLWLKREFRAVASLRHPNLVELYELVAHDRSCYFTMEYLDGVDPRRWVTRRRPLEIEANPTRVLSDAKTEMSLGAAGDTLPAPAPPPDVDFARVRVVLAQLAEALTFLHARGVIHRDVKPSNVIVGDGVVKLLDFGLALERRRAEEELARETRIVGTVAYLAPEYLDRLNISPAMDVYALGVLAFELATGAPPFGGVVHVLTRTKRRVEPPRASLLNPAVPADLDDLIDQMLASDPLRRPTALQVAVRLTGGRSEARQARRESQFVGRHGELARLDARIHDPVPRGRLVLVTGPSGVGKTALIEEALGRARIAADDTREALVWRGRCHERERVPYRAFDFVIDDVASELVVDPGLADAIEHTGALGRVFPALASVLGDADDPPATDLRVERERALVAMTQLFEQVLVGRGGIVVIDDLQWADDDSLALLALVLERIAQPLTVIASWTREPPLPDAVRSLAADVIELAALSQHEACELIGAIAPRAPTERLRAAAEQTAGNPYLAELIGLELADERDTDLRDAELRRLERLAAAERKVSEWTAISIGVATFEQLRALAELPSAQLHSVLRNLEDVRILKATPSPSGDPVYTFYHQRLRDAAHAALAPDQRRAAHARFAAHLEREAAPADQLAYHYEQAGLAAEAVRWFVIAAEAAHAQLAWRLAADRYGRAMDLGAAQYRAERAECLFLAGKLAEAALDFEALARESAADGDRWRVRAAESYIKLGELERGLAILDGVLARRGEPRARGRVASLVRTVGVATHWLVAPKDRRAPVDAVLVAAHRVIASFLSTPYPIESFEYVLRGIATAQRAGDHDAHSLGMAMLAAYLATGSLGRFGDRALATAHRLAAQSGAPYPRMVAAGCGGIVATLRGNWPAMRAAHEEGRRICDKMGLARSWEASFLRTYHGLGEYYAGEPARALAILGELEETSDDLISRALLGSYRGRALVQGGNLAAARVLERELAVQPAARRGTTSIYRQIFSGELALAEGDAHRAHAIGSEAARDARTQWLAMLPAVSAMTDTLLATAELALGDPRSARSARTRVRALYRRGHASFYAATALRLWAQAERILGDEPAARTLLARAAAVAAERGSRFDRQAIAELAKE